jgi:hypothetical protein
MTTIERVEELANRLNAVLLPIARDRLDAMGEEEAGAYNFYAVRIARGDLFADYDRLLCARLIDDPDCPARVHEIGGGYGSFSWLMAGTGYETVCLEVDRRRFVGGVALWQAAEQAWPELSGRLRFVLDRFPSVEVTPDSAWAVATNLVATTNANQRAAIMAALAGYQGAVIDVDRFLDQARSDADRARTIDDFWQSGLIATPYLDLGDHARFYRVGPGS